jgi:hypothetical protein
MKTRAFAALVPALVVALVATATPAHAKGAQDATLKGPGLEHVVRLRDEQLGSLLRAAGLYQSVFHQPGSRVSATRPAGRLGPRYTVTYGWLVAQDETEPIRQFVYPFASGGAVTFTPPKQRVGSMTELLDGGWFQGGSELRALLVSLGVPDRAKAA